MPIYEYQCQACGHVFEAIQKMADEPLKKCPECNKSKLQKLVSAAGFRLSGGGWYETDFKSGKKKNVTESGSGSGDKSGSGGGDKSGAVKACSGGCGS
jgi:putative FmdB family regulatory protein